MKIKNLIKKIFQVSPTKELEVQRIKLIRESSEANLKNQIYLENLLCKLGLNDEELFNFPKELYSYCGNGLNSWQYPSQFSKYLIKLSEYGITSYLEIGAKHGGTFIITVEYLQKFNQINKSFAIDLFPIKGLMDYKRFNPHAKALIINSRTIDFKNFIIKKGPFDLVLIDGDHSYEGCLSDFEIMKNHAKMLAFHDIVGMGVPGVMQVWQEVKLKYNGEFEFYEFIDQYSEVFNETKKTWLGIGLAIKK